VTGAEQLLDQREADEPGSAEDEHAHQVFTVRNPLVARWPYSLSRRNRFTLRPLASEPF
jgi:hypothetical protein